MVDHYEKESKFLKIHILENKRNSSSKNNNESIYSFTRKTDLSEENKCRSTKELVRITTESDSGTNKNNSKYIYFL